MLGISTKNPNQSSTINTWLIPINISVLIILSGLIFYNVVKALKHLRSKRAGCISRLLFFDEFYRRSNR